MSWRKNFGKGRFLRSNVCMILTGVRQWKWVIAMDDSTIDRGTPKTVPSFYRSMRRGQAG